MKRQSTFGLYILGSALFYCALDTIPIVYYLFPWEDLLLARPDISRQLSIMFALGGIVSFTLGIKIRADRYVEKFDRHRIWITFIMALAVLSGFMRFTQDFWHISVLIMVCTASIISSPYRWTELGTLDTLQRSMTIGWVSVIVLMGLGSGAEWSMLLLMTTTDVILYTYLCQFAVYISLVRVVVFSVLYTDIHTSIMISVTVIGFSTLMYYAPYIGSIMNIYVLLTLHLIVLIKTYLRYSGNLRIFNGKTREECSELIYTHTGLSDRTSGWITNNIFGPK